MKISAFILSVFFMIFSAPVQAQEGYAGSWEMGLQKPASPLKAQIDEFHSLLLYIVIAIVVVVTLLLLYAIIKFRRRKNVEPATFAHNTLIEVLWTILPIVILIVIAIPSFKLLYFEDRIPDPDLTIKVTGYQWYWGYEYSDYDGLEFLSYMVPENEINESEGQRRLLSTDNPVVVPVGENIQIGITSADVIHAFAIPAAGIKRDAVPGRLNQSWVRFDREGTYFGQCSEICGTGHAYMPIEFKVVSREEFDTWVASKGGTLKPLEPVAAKEVMQEEIQEDLQDDNLGNNPEGDVENSETPAPDFEENKLKNPNVEEENVSNPGK